MMTFEKVMSVAGGRASKILSLNNETETAATGPAEKHLSAVKDQPSDEGAGNSQNYGGRYEGIPRRQVRRFVKYLEISVASYYRK